MIRMYLISVYFDENTNKTIQNLINRVAKASGNTYMIDNKVPPHMTITAIQAKEPEKLITCFESLKGNIISGKINIVSPGQLLPYVMYIAPVLNEYLDKISKEIASVTENVSGVKLSKYYRPYSWLPHITIGKTLSHDEMIKAFQIMHQYFVPFEASVTEIGLARTNPHEDIVRFDLLS